MPTGTVLIMTETPPLWDELVPPKVPLTRTGKIAWLMSFIDLLSILLCAFVLMFAMQSTDMREWQTLRGSFHNAFHGDQPVSGAVLPVGRLNAAVPEEASDIRLPLTDGLAYLNSVLQQQVNGDRVWADMQPRYDDRRRWVDYAVPAGATPADWERLAKIVRRWDNAIMLVVVAPADAAVAALTATAMQATILQAQGVLRMNGVAWQPAVGVVGGSKVVLRIMGSEA